MTTQTAPLPIATIIPIPAAFCDECGEPFPMTAHAKGINQTLCGPACNAIRHKRRMKDAYKIIKAVIRWRLDRDKDALTDMCHMLDNGLIDEERKIRAKRDKRIAVEKTKLKRRKSA